MQVKLVIVGGKASKSEVSVKLPTVIGRSREADLTVAHPMISRKHCELYETNGQVMVRDLGSLNGLFLGSAQVRDAALRPNDEFTVGPLTFRVEYEGPPPGGPPPGGTTIDERRAEPMTAVGAEEPDLEGTDASFPPPLEEGAVFSDLPPRVHEEAAQEEAAQEEATPEWPQPSVGGSQPAIAPPDGQLPDFSPWQEGGASAQPPNKAGNEAPGHEAIEPGRLPSPEMSAPETEMSVPETTSFDQRPLADAVEPRSSTPPPGGPAEENAGSAGEEADAEQTAAEGMFDLALPPEAESEEDESDDLDKFLKGLD